MNSLGAMLNYLSDGALLLIALLNLSNKYKYIYIYICAAFSGVVYFVSTAIYTEYNPLSMLANHLKVYLPFLLYPILMECYNNNSQYFVLLVKKLVFSILILLFLAVLFFPGSSNRLEVWWPSYFGGVHTTSYISFLVISLGVGLYSKGFLSARLLFLLVIGLSYSIYFGWGVRTATIATALFISGVVINRMELNGRPVKYYVFLVMPLLLMIMASNFSFDESMNEVSSGRLYMYQEKYNQVMGNSFLQWVIGNGYRSDLIETDVWWWEEKGAHSDVITFLVEGGAVYLVCFICLVYNIARSETWAFKSLIAASFFTAMFSNGIFVRPIAGYLLIICLVVLSHEGFMGRKHSDK